MPRQFTAMRDHFIREGMKQKAAKAKAAKIYNSTHPRTPVGARDNRDNRNNRDNRDSD